MIVIDACNWGSSYLARNYVDSWPNNNEQSLTRVVQLLLDSKLASNGNTIMNQPVEWIHSGLYMFCSELSNSSNVGHSLSPFMVPLIGFSVHSLSDPWQDSVHSRLLVFATNHNAWKVRAYLFLKQCTSSRQSLSTLSRGDDLSKQPFMIGSVYKHKLLIILPYSWWWTSFLTSLLTMSYWNTPLYYTHCYPHILPALHGYNPIWY